MKDPAEVAAVPSRTGPVLAATFFGYVIARACGLPKWADHVGDAFDVAMACFWLSFTMLGFVRKILMEQQG